MSSAGGVQRPEYADFRYQEAVGHLKQLLADGGSCSGRGSDAGSVRSRARSASRALRPDLSSYRAEASSYRRHVSSSRLHSSTYRADTTGYRSAIASYRPDTASIRPQSAMEVGSSRRFEPLSVGTGSVRALSPVSVRSLRLADDVMGPTGDATGLDAVDSTGGNHMKLGDNGNTDYQQIQVLELRQLSLRQEALTQQLEEENTELRDAADELRGYVQRLVAENGALAEDLRAQVSESVSAEAVKAAETRLKESREEQDQLRRQMTAQERRLKAEHAELLRNANVEREKLAETIEKLKDELAELRREAEKADQKAAASLQQAEQAHSARSEADATVSRLRRELEERDRRADRVQMEHERRLVAAREQAEQAVRDSFDKLQHQLERQQQRISQLEDDAERHQRQEKELKSALQQQRQAVTQAKLDADSVAQRHQRELQVLQKRLQPAVPVGAGQERLRREVVTLRQQLTAAENQLTVANRERGRLQQQMWRLDRRPDATLDRDSLAGVLGDDGMALPPRQLSRILSRTAGGGGSQLPTSYRQVKDSDPGQPTSSPAPGEESTTSSSASLPPSRGSPAINRKLSQPIMGRGSPTITRKLSQGSPQSRGSPSPLRRAQPETGSTETVTEIIEIISPRGDIVQRTETEHSATVPTEQPSELHEVRQEDKQQPDQQGHEEAQHPQQPPDKKEKQQKNQEHQREQRQQQDLKAQPEAHHEKDEKEHPQEQREQPKQSKQRQQELSQQQQQSDSKLKQTPKPQQDPTMAGSAVDTKESGDVGKEAKKLSEKPTTSGKAQTPK